MSYRGQVSFQDLLNAWKYGWQPEARVFLQEIQPNGLAGSVVRELKGWTAVNVSRVIGGKGRCAIQLANIDDRYFRAKGQRSFDATTQDVVTGYLNDVLTKSLPYVKEISKARRGNDVNPSFQGIRAFTGQQLDDYLFYVYNFTGNVPILSRNPTTAATDLVDLGLMQRVFVDVKGQDGLWYAAFSGLLSGISEDYKVGETSVITLTCSDLWRLFGLSEINLQIGPDPIQDTILFDVQSRTGDFLNGINSTILNGLDGVDIVQRVLTFTQAALCYQSYIAVNPSVQGLVREDFFFSEPFWNLQPGLQPVQGSYAGLNGLRRIDDNKTADGTGVYDGCSVTALTANYLVDANIRTGMAGEVYQRLIRRILGFWQAQHISGDALVKKVADATYFDIFFNGNGDLVYQIPRYNNSPGEYNPTFVQVPQAVQGSGTDPSSPMSAGAQAIALQKAQYKFPEQPEGLYDFVSSQYGFSHKYHGYNYVITDLGLRGWRVGSNEESIVTGVRVPGGGDLLTQGAGQQINTYTFTGRTAIDDKCGIPLGTVGQIQRRYGVRVREMQQIFIPDLYGSSNPRALLDAFALATMQQINAGAVGGSLSTDMRPDLDVGNNVLMVERQLLAYIMSVDLTVINGKDASSVFTLNYGHDIATDVPIPWLTVKQPITTIPQAPQPTPAIQQGFGAIPAKADGSPNVTPTVVGGGTTSLVVPIGRLGVERTFGKFSYVKSGQPLPGGGTCSATGGHICITDNFVASNIVSLEVVLPNSARETIQVHRLAVPFFRAAFNRMRNDPQLASETVRIIQAFSPRLTWNDPASDRLSFHSWGIALDIAVGTDTHDNGQWICEKNVLIWPHFKAAGFYWGGQSGDYKGFKRRDDVHFQLAFPDTKAEFLSVTVSNTNQVE